MRLDRRLDLIGRVRVSGGTAAPAELAVRATRHGFRLQGRVGGREARASVRTYPPAE
jgi:hypothetical protein